MAHKSQELREQAAEMASTVGESIGPHLRQAREQAAPVIAEARERFTDEVLPAVQSALADAREQAAPVAAEARKRGRAAGRALAGERPRRGGRTKWVVLLLGLAGAAAVASRKILGGDSSPAHHSATTPYVPPVPEQPGMTETDPAAAEVLVSEPGEESQPQT